MKTDPHQASLASAQSCQHAGLYPPRPSQAVYPGVAGSLLHCLFWSEGSVKLHPDPEVT